MKKNETKIFDTAFQGIVAVITVRKKGNTYHFTGKLANKFGGVLTEYTPCRRTAKVKNDWPYREIVNALEKKIRKKYKPVIPGKKPDNAAPLSPEAQNIQKAFSKVKAMNPEEIYDNWIRSTATSALKYFERHILPLLSQRADVSCTRETALLIQKKIRDTFRVSKANDLAAENRAVFRHLQEAEKIYRCMDHLSEELLPVFDFSADSTLFARQEQFKVFPPADRRKIVKILEEEAAKNPLLVKRFVAMFDAGLRTGEACAVQFDNIQERVTPTGIRYGLYCVEGQEDPANKGKVTKLLKTANAYRTVLFSSWGYGMICRCNQLAPETPSDTLPVTSVALCKEFRRIMGEIGITPETLMLYRQESGNAELDPAAGETLADAKLSDYIMRRDRASRWKNVCGMSSAEIDMLLGHKINGVNTYMHRKCRNEFTQPENLDRLAELNENFRYHPDIPPEISLTDRSAETIPLPPRRVQIIRNNSDHPIEVLLNLQTIEPGDSIIERGASACRPEASVQSLPVSMKNPRPALGKGEKEEKYDDGKADLSLG